MTPELVVALVIYLVLIGLFIGLCFFIVAMIEDREWGLVAMFFCFALALLVFLVAPFFIHTDKTPQQPELSTK